MYRCDVLEGQTDTFSIFSVMLSFLYLEVMLPLHICSSTKIYRTRSSKQQKSGFSLMAEQNENKACGLNLFNIFLNRLNGLLD